MSYALKKWGKKKSTCCIIWVASYAKQPRGWALIFLQQPLERLPIWRAQNHCAQSAIVRRSFWSDPKPGWINFSYYFTTTLISIVVPSSIVTSHTCNTIAVTNKPTRVSPHVWIHSHWRTRIHTCEPLIWNLVPVCGVTMSPSRVCVCSDYVAITLCQYHVSTRSIHNIDIVNT